jgi:hypothetical protein
LLLQFSLAFLYGQQPEAKVVVPKPIEQPIPFNHKKHCDVGLGCDTCHKLDPKGDLEQIPSAADCMNCHQAIKTDSPDVQVLAQYAKEAKPIPWVRVYTIPDFVLFSHKTHLDAKIKCEECHGPVSSREVLAREKDFTMKTCISCHRADKAKTTCDVCHKLSM